MEQGMGPTEIGQELRVQREVRGWTQQEVADRADVAVSTVCEVEKSMREDRPLPPAAARIAAVFGLEIRACYDLRVRPLRRGGVREP